MSRHGCARLRLVRNLILAASIALAFGCAGSQGPGSSGTNPGGGAPGSVSSPGPGSSSGSTNPGVTVIQRAQSAVEGLLMGAIIGGQAGPLGAAVGAGTMMIYAAITGDVPFQAGGLGGGGGPGGGGLGSGEAQREAELENQIEEEMARQDTLEAEIEEELRRQEELLRQIEGGDTAVASTPPPAPAETTPPPATTETTPLPATPAPRTAVAPTGAAAEPEVLARVDPRVAPTAPRDRQLPVAIFDEERRTIDKGEWDNNKKIKVLVRSLDADRDGHPEEIRYHDEATGAMLRKEQDRDYDGNVDTWTRYESGLPVEVVRDNDDDGRPDEWQEYGRDGRMERREVDRDGDGRRDAFYVFEDGSLIEERHDGDGSGSIDRVVVYEDRRLSRAEEDRDHDGKIDTWTTYRADGEQEVISRIERDTDADGQRDTFESYETRGGKTQISLKEEDKDGDGVVDVKSIYQDGKLKQREISDPGFTPL